MTVITKSNRPSKTKQNVPNPVLASGKSTELSPDDIEFSPINYRKYYRPDNLESFAEELKLHGIICSLAVRKGVRKKYQLVAGERRLRAARIAGLVTVPVTVHDLTDEQVTEIQLAENLQRENPHPMDEASAVSLMQQTGKSIDEIAARLGKSKQFVYIRLKLLNLIDAIQEMFFENVISLTEALELASISYDGQQDFFQTHCNEWKEKKYFDYSNLRYYLRQYKYDLNNAPFSTKDKKLLPDVGACTTCSFNTATLKSLFSEYAKQAICSNPTCYNTKCSTHEKIQLLNLVLEHTPTALLVWGEASPTLKDIVTQHEALSHLTVYYKNEVTILEVPEMPTKEEYTTDYGGGEPEFEEEDYNDAVQEYEYALTEYLVYQESGLYQKGLLQSEGKFNPVLFSLEKPKVTAPHKGSTCVSMKEVQAAIKAKKVTKFMLNEAISTINEREIRAKELDHEKVHLQVHHQFEAILQENKLNSALTPVDIVAVRLLVYHSLDYNSRRIVTEALFSDSEETLDDRQNRIYEQLYALTEAQFAYLVRMAIVSKSESKIPGHDIGYMVFKLAEAVGIDVLKAEQEQEVKANARAGRVHEKIKQLEKQIEKAP